MSRADPQVNIRMPQPLKEKLEAAAQGNKRSLNSEIVHKLEKSSAAVQDDYIKTALRLPRDLHQTLQSQAEKDGCSLNAEIIGRLSASLDALPVMKMLEEVGRLIAELRQERDYWKGKAR